MKSFLVSASLALLPASGYALDFQSAATLGFSAGSVSGGGGDTKGYSLDIAGRADFENGFVLNFDLGSAKTENSTAATDTTIGSVRVNGVYTLSNGLGFGAYLEHSEINEATTLNGSLTSYGLIGGYSTDTFGVQAFFGESQTSPAFGGATKIYDYGLNLSARPTDQLTLAGNFIRTRLKNGGAKLDYDLVNVAAAYEINDQWLVYGGFSHSDVAVPNVSINTASIGGAYAFQSNSAFPVTLSVELSRSTISGGGASNQLDTVQVGVTIPFGGGKIGTPLNSHANTVLRPSHSWITSTVLGLY